MHFVIPGRAEVTVVGNLVLSWGGAWLLLAHSPSPSWLPWAVGAGVLTHIAGDALTREGVPLPLLWIPCRGRLALVPLRTGTTVEKAVLAPLFLLIAIVFGYVNTGARELLDPLWQRIVALG